MNSLNKEMLKLIKNKKTKCLSKIESDRIAKYIKGKK